MVAALIVLALVLGVVAADPIAAAIRRVFTIATPGHVLVLACVIAAVGLLLAGWRRRRRSAPQPLESFPAGPTRVRRFLAGIEMTPWPLTVGLVVAWAGVAWYSLGRAAAVPRIFSDELLYATTARGIADQGRVLNSGYGVVAPGIDAAAYLLTRSDVDAYRLIQLINAVMIVSAAVPAYLLARRVLSHSPALAVAALSAILPWLVSARFVMTEAAFYPIFLLFVLALVRALEHPSGLRQLALGLALIVAYETRTQAVALAGAVATAVAVYGLARGDLRGAIRSFTPTWSVYGVAAIAGLALSMAGIWQPLGAYRVLLSHIWHPHSLLVWVAANVTSMTLGLGVLVVVAAPLGAAALLRHGTTASEQAFAAAAVSATLWVLLTVAVLSESPYGQGVPHERSLFFVAPFVIACALAWASRGFPRPWHITAATVLGLIAFAILMPDGVITVHSIDDLSFRLWARLPRAGLSASMVMIVGVAVGGLIIVRLRSTWPLIASLLVATLGVSAASDRHSDQDRSFTPLYAWVDRTMPAGANAMILWVGVDESRCPVVMADSYLGKLAVYTEFFNSRIGEVGHVLGDNPDRGLATEAFEIDGNRVVSQAGALLRPDYIVVDARIGIAGRRVARLGAGEVGLSDARRNSALALWRADKPLRLRDPEAVLAPPAACAPFPTPASG